MPMPTDNRPKSATEGMFSIYTPPYDRLPVRAAQQAHIGCNVGTAVESLIL